MIKMLTEIIKLEWKATKLILRLQWRIVKAIFKLYVLFAFIAICANVGSEYSISWGWFLFLAPLFLVPRFDKEKKVTDVKLA